MIDAYDWYEAQQQGLGDRFYNAVEQAAGSAAEFPDAYPNKYKNTREILIAPFPYLMIYIRERNKIFIKAIFAAKKKPSGKYRV